MHSHITKIITLFLAVSLLVGIHSFSPKVITSNQAPTTITVSNTIIQPSIFGSGTNIMYDAVFPDITSVSAQDHANNRLKKLKEVRDGYFRMFYSLKDFNPSDGVYTPDSDQMKQMYTILDLMKAQNNTILLVNGYWFGHPEYLGGGQALTDQTLIDRWAVEQTKFLKNLLDRGYINLHWSITNEMQTSNEPGTENGWSHFYYQGKMDSYKQHQLSIHQNLVSQGIRGRIKLIYFDGGNIESHRWSIDDTLDIAEAIDYFGAHHYSAEDDQYFDQNLTSQSINTMSGESAYTDAMVRYQNLLTLYRSYTQLWRRNGNKSGALGEFGTSSQNYEYTTDDNPNQSALLFAEKTLASYNAGMIGDQSWEFEDFPSYSSRYFDYNYGMISSIGTGSKPKNRYFAQMLLSKFIKNGYSTLESSTNNPSSNLITLGLRNQNNQKTLIVINYNQQATTVNFDGFSQGSLQKFSFSQSFSLPTQNSFGDISQYDKILASSESDVLTPGQIAIYTENIDITNMDKCTLDVIPSSANTTLRWNSTSEANYYRVYGGNQPILSPNSAFQLTSTYLQEYSTLTQFPYYSVASVDFYGNVSSLCHWDNNPKSPQSTTLPLTGSGTLPSPTLTPTTVSPHSLATTIRSGGYNVLGIVSSFILTLIISMEWYYKSKKPSSKISNSKKLTIKKTKILT